jgi:hypothetical protein
VTDGWVTAAALSPTEPTATPKQGRIVGNQVRVFDRFRLTKGHGVPVCEAYLQRLNVTTFEQIPQCGRPENDSVPGFRLLHRDTPAKDELARLAQHVTNFMVGQKQDSLDTYLDKQGHRKTSATDYERQVRNPDLRVWRYDPPVDIDNDGQPDSVLMWQGPGASDYCQTCGSSQAGRPDPFVVQQRPFILRPASDWIDEDRTRAIFGRPHAPKFDDFLGPSISIFEYRGRVYFDSFFDPLRGDFEGNLRASDRGAQVTVAGNVALLDILGVFERRGNVTGQICEYAVTSEVKPCKDNVCIR